MNQSSGATTVFFSAASASLVVAYTIWLKRETVLRMCRSGSECSGVAQ
jgi:heme O synthase-like polyprenyltransferase